MSISGTPEHEARSASSRWRWRLRLRTGAGMIIPPEARVEPELFPEDEFPICCPACDYLLRGLPEPRCPECGRPFDRGRLLVEQYVIQHEPCDGKPTSAALKWMFRLGIFLLLSQAALLWWFGDDLVMRAIRRWGVSAIAFLVSLGPVLLGFALVWTSLMLQPKITAAHKRKRRMVAQALNQSSPEFKHAKRYGIVLSSLAIAAMLAVALYELRDADAFSYYSRNLSLLLLPIPLALGGVAAYLTLLRIRAWVRKRRSP